MENQGLPHQDQGIKKPNKILLFFLGIVFVILFLLLIFFFIGVAAIVAIFVFAFVVLIILLRLFVRYFKYILAAFIVVFVIGAIILFMKNYYGNSLTSNLSLYVYIGVGLLIIAVIAGVFYYRSKKVEVYLPAHYTKKQKHNK